MNRERTMLLGGLALVAGMTAATAMAAGAAPAQPVPGAMDTGSLLAPALRMVLSLGAVLGLVAALAWFAQRLRAGGKIKSGLIEIVSGVSLGAREKVVLLRIGQEQVLVGVSPAGMRALHVMKDASPTPPFSNYMEPKP